MCLCDLEQVEGPGLATSAAVLGATSASTTTPSSAASSITPGARSGPGAERERGSHDPGSCHPHSSTDGSTDHYTPYPTDRHRVRDSRRGEGLSDTSSSPVVVLPVPNAPIAPGAPVNDTSPLSAYGDDFRDENAPGFADSKSHAMVDRRQKGARSTPSATSSPEDEAKDESRSRSFCGGNGERGRAEVRSEKVDSRAFPVSHVEESGVSCRSTRSLPILPCLDSTFRDTRPSDIY